MKVRYPSVVYPQIWVMPPKALFKPLAPTEQAAQKQLVEKVPRLWGKVMHSFWKYGAESLGAPGVV